MAPVHKPLLKARQHSHLLPPHHGKGPPGSAVHVLERISLKTFIILLIASFCIFFLAVACWKFGTFTRRFSAHRVLGDKKSASTRYARTWYGWVPLEKHESKKQKGKQWFSNFRQMMAFRSSHADYSWVWWDPGGNGLDGHFQQLRKVRWIPRCFMSYDYYGADLVWNPVPPNQQAPDGYTRRPESPPNLSLRSARRALGHMVKTRRRPPVSRIIPLDGLNEDIVSSIISNNEGHASDMGDLELSRTPNDQAPFSSPPQRRLKSSSSCRSSLADMSAQRTISEFLLPPQTHCASRELQRTTDAISSPTSSVCKGKQLRKYFRSSVVSRSSSCVEPIIEEAPSDKEGSRRRQIPKGTNLTWKYKAWAAKMQIQTFAYTPPQLRGLAGRPGSPAPDILSAFVSSCIGSEASVRRTEMMSSIRAPESSRAALRPPITTRFQRGQSRLRSSLDHSQVCVSSGKADAETKIGQDISRRRDDASASSTTSTYRASSVANAAPVALQRRGPSISVEASAAALRPPRNRKQYRSDPIPFSRTKLSNPEIRLVCDLERKLEWLSSEVEPGRKPYHFLILANHWLNRETWIVYDPVSRVPLEERRLYGDPRVNHPWPDSRNEPPRPKHFQPERTKAYTPRLDSWRLAVNKARKCSGVLDYLKTIDLFDGSADETPDGAIDPASWVLPKTCGGFELANKQKDAWWEGGGGWCEKLEDWQHVGRAYRARKVICEGKANRRRVVEIAQSVKGSCKKTKRRLTPIRSRLKVCEKDVRPTVRNEQSGRGSIPRRYRKITRRIVSRPKVQFTNRSTISVPQEPQGDVVADAISTVPPDMTSQSSNQESRTPSPVPLGQLDTG